MMASMLQFSENLTDRQAAEAVWDLMTGKYALGLELEDPRFDASVLSEFRSRLVAGDLTSLALDAPLERLAGLGLVRADGRQRTASAHVLGAIRALNLWVPNIHPRWSECELDSRRARHAWPLSYWWLSHLNVFKSSA